MYWYCLYHGRKVEKISSEMTLPLPLPNRKKKMLEVQWWPRPEPESWVWTESCKRSELCVLGLQVDHLPLNMENLLIYWFLNILWLYRNIIVAHDGEDQADHQHEAGKQNEFGPLQEKINIRTEHGKPETKGIFIGWGLGSRLTPRFTI